MAVLEPASEPGAVRFHFFNNDGSRCEMCGNGALCATTLAARLEMAPAEGMILQTDAGDIPARVLETPDQRSEIGLPAVTARETPKIRLQGRETAVHPLRVGVPHLVVEVDNQELERLDVNRRGRELREHPALPDGANVNFVTLTDGTWKMRTYERGVEAETLACGTGAVAVATALARAGRAMFPFEVETASGKVLRVAGSLCPDQSDNLVFEARLSGEGRVVYRAVID